VLDPRQRRRHSQQAGAVARRLDELHHPCLARRAVQHRQVAILRAVALRQALRRHLEAAQMGRKEQHAFASTVLRVYQPAALPFKMRRSPHPQARQLGDHTARVAHGGAYLASRKARLRSIGLKARPVHARAQVGQPAQQCAQGM
jgi:hypothetical protein